MHGFTYRATSTNVTFGLGTLSNLPDVVRQVAGTRVLILSTPEQAAQAAAIADLLPGLVVGHFDAATMHTPVEVTERAMTLVRDRGVDVVVGFGGGSTIGLGKAIALRTNIVQVAIPTTYAGSEMTPILGQTENGRKTTLRDDRVRPVAVIYDVELTLGLPASLSGTSGLNAIAHAVEGLYAQDTNPVMQLIAEEGIRALASALPKIVRAPDDIEARSEALYGSWLCAMVLGAVGMALHHKLCHTVGGAFDLPHADTHAVILPHVVAYNGPSAVDAMARLSRALGDGEPAGALYALARAVGAPTALRDLGMPQDGIERAAAEAVRNPYWNPRAVEHSAIAALLTRAWAGEAPAL